MELYVNGIRHKPESVSPATTLLRYLRVDAGLKGTKEGCASGDCGACTVLVCDQQGKLMSVNACITLLGSVAGMQVYTVDGLASLAIDSDQALHPVQQAMVDCHGSQCGFCTPGFVMSLAGLYQECAEEGVVEIDTERASEAISGNLCRCTGYRPILDAAKTMMSYDAVQHFQPPPQSVTHDNEATQGSDGYFRPTSESALKQILSAHPDPFIVAGGTDKVLEVSQNYADPDVVVDLTAVAELLGIESDDDYLYIGGAVCYSDIEKYFASLSSEFVALLKRLGSRQIRNRGSLGGNIANGSPIADTPPLLMAWLADIELAGVENEARWVAVNEFYLGYRKTILKPGEYIRQIRVPIREVEKPHRIYKVSKRFEDDISAVMGAFVLEVEDTQINQVRIAYGGMAATPIRAKKTEGFLTGTSLTEDTLAEACILLASEFSPMSDVRATAEYRRHMAVNMFQRAVSEIAGVHLPLGVAVDLATLVEEEDA